MPVSQQQNASNGGANSQDPNQPGSERRSSDNFDDLFDDRHPGSLGDVGPSGQQDGGFGMSGLDIDWSIPLGMAGAPVYQTPDFNARASHTPSMNQVFDPLVPSHMGAQQHQWNAGNHFHPGDPSANNFGAPSLFNSTGFPNPDSSTGHAQQRQFSSAAGNDPRNIPQFETQGAGGGQGAPAQRSAVLGASFGVRSPPVNPQALPLAGMPSQTANRNPPARLFHPGPEPVANGTRTSLTNNQAFQIEESAPANAPLATSGLTIPAHAPYEPNLGEGEGNVSIPDWIVFIKPYPQAGERIITLRRETHIALDIIFERLPRQTPAGFSGVKIPATGSVKNHADAIGGTLLEFSVRVYGATTGQLYTTVCPSCEKREGKRRGTPSLIDFHALQDVIKPKDGKIRVDFNFCCYSNCRQESGYMLEVVISEAGAQNPILAQYRLPFPFNVVTRLPKVPGPSLAGGKRTRGEVERSEGAPSGAGRRNVRRRREDAPHGGPRGDEGIDHLMLPSNHRSAPQDHEDSSSNPSPPAPPAVHLPNPDPLSAWRPPNQGIAPPRTAEEPPAPTLTEVNPASGSITGGARIWLTGMDFPAVFPLFARFGGAVVPTTYSAANLLACNLPAAPTPGVVDVTLSKHPQPSAPEYGTSIARFHYLGDQDQLIPILLRIQGHGYPEFSPVLQALLTALNGPQPNRGLQGGSHGAGPRDDPIEAGLIEALSCLQERPNFREIVSTTNDYNQTLAHLSIFYEYPSLLGRLVEWGINLTIADVNGLTALHCAYMKGDLDSVRTLRRGGASENAVDKLGRTPSELQPEGLEGFDSDIDLDAEYAAGIDADLPETNDIDEQLALGEQFSALDLDDDNDSGHGQSDSEDDASEDEDPDGMVVDSFTGGDEGGSGGVASGSGGGQVASSSKEPAINIMNQLLLEKNRRRKKKNPGPRMLPDTPYDAAISSVSKKLREAEAEPEAVDFLTTGIFPDGMISLVSLKTDMTAEEVGEFQSAPGTLKYHGLLRRDREIVYCRLCPEDNQLDFKDPEEALHHMTKDHFDMGYSCDCGCNETYWTSADWRRHRKRKGLSLTPGQTQGQVQGEGQMQVVTAN